MRGLVFPLTIGIRQLSRSRKHPRRFALVVFVPWRCCLMRFWWKDPAGSASTKDLAHDIPERSLSLASGDRPVISIEADLVEGCPISVDGARRYGTRLFADAVRSNLHQRSLLVQSGLRGGFELDPSKGTVMRVIHGELSLEDPCSLGLSRISRRRQCLNVQLWKRDIAENCKDCGTTSRVNE